MPSQSFGAVDRAIAAYDETASLFIVTPHRSFNERGLWIFHATLCGIALLGQIIFLAIGLWPISIFLGLDALALIFAVHIHSQCRKHRREEIMVTATEVVIRRFAFRSPMREERLQSPGLRLTRCEDPEHGCQKLLLNSWRTETEIARDLSPAERGAFAVALTQALRATGIAVAIDVRSSYSPFSG
jgi:uncharacterized membrane protein